MFYINNVLYIYVYIIYISLYLHIIKYKQEEAKVPLPSETRGVKSIEVRTGFLGWCFADNHLLSPELTTTTKSPTANKSKNTCCLTPNHKGSFVPGPWTMENPCRSGRFSSKGNGAKASRHPRLATNLGEIWEQLERLVSLLAWREAWPAEGQEESTICLRVNFN